MTQSTPRDGLRRLCADEWRAFFDIRLEMLRDAPRCFGSTQAEWAVKTPEQVAAWLDSIHMWAVVEGGRIVATAGWHPLKGSVVCHRGHVIAIYTTCTARGRGLSRDLLRAVAQDASAQNITQLELDVGAENAIAIALYKSEGYAIIGTIANCLNHDGYIHDQHLMVRFLTA